MSTTARRRWRRIVAGTLMAGSLAVTTACGVAASDATTNQSTGSSSHSGGSGTTLGQGTTASHATSQGS